MSDNSRVSEWMPSITKMEAVSGTPHAVGAVSNIYVVENGEEMVMQETITALEDNKHIAMTFSMDFMEMKYSMTMETKDGKTMIRSNSDVSGNGMFAKSMVALMAGAMEKQESTHLNNLKNVIEGNTKDYFNVSDSNESNIEANESSNLSNE